MSQYLGRGVTSRGRMTIDSAMTTHVATHPYLHDENDVAAVIQGINNLRNALKGYANLTFAVPADNLTTEAYVSSYIVSPATRRANHWMGKNTHMSLLFTTNDDTIIQPYLSS